MLPMLKNVPFSSEGSMLLSEGFNSRVFKAAGGWLVKVAKQEDGWVGILNEQAVLAAMPALAVETPRDYTAIEPGPDLPYGGSYYRGIEGDACCDVDALVQKQLAGILRANIRAQAVINRRVVDELGCLGDGLKRIVGGEHDAAPDRAGTGPLHSGAGQGQTGRRHCHPQPLASTTRLRC